MQAQTEGDNIHLDADSNFGQFCVIRTRFALNG
jgi:hypothetical protein